MRELRINSHLADIAPDELIEIERKSSLFQHDKIEGSFSVQYALPYEKSPRNQVIFGFAGNVSVPGTTVELPYTLKFADLQIAAGKLIASGAEQDVLVQILVDSSNFVDFIAEKTLQDFDFGIQGLYAGQYHFDQAQDILAFAEFENPGQFSGLLFDYSTRQIPTTQMVTTSNIRDGLVLKTSSNDYYEAIYDGATVTGYREWNYTNCPQIFVQPLLEKIFEVAGYRLTDSFLNRTPFYNLALFSAYDFNDYIASNRTLDNQNIADVLPARSVKDLLLAVMNTFCAAFVFHKNTVQLILYTDILDNTETHALPASFAILSVKNDPADGYRIEHTPDTADRAVLYQEIDPSELATRSIPNPDSFLIVNNDRTKYFLRTEDDYIYQRADEGFRGMNAGLGKLEKVSVSHPQPLQVGAGEVKFTSPASPFGYNYIDACDITTVNKTYVQDKFEHLRFGFVSQIVQGDCRFVQGNEHLSLLRPDQYPPMGAGTSLKSLCFDSYGRWLGRRKKIEAEISGSDALLFLQSYHPTKKYHDGDGNHYIITDLVESYAHDRIVGVRLAGWTV